MRAPYPDNQRGSAMALVLIFSTLALAMATGYLISQRRNAVYWLSQPRTLQARLNAYSAVYWALDYLRDSTQADTLPVIDATDPFNAHLLAGQDPMGLLEDERLPLTGEPTDVPLYDSGGFGTAIVARLLSGASIRLEAEGEYQGVVKRVDALLGSRWPGVGDTLVHVVTGPIETTYGSFLYQEGGYDSTDFRTNDLQEILKALQEEMVDSLGIPGLSLPTTVMDEEDLAKIPERVEGDLVLDGSFGALRWQADRRIVVEGDLQTTGEVILHDLDFVVQGETRIFDESELHSVSLVTRKRFVMMGTSRFSGDVLSLADIVLADETEVQDKSMLVAVGNPASSAGAGRTAGSGSAGAAGGTSGAGGTPAFAIVLADFALVDGTLVAVRGNGGIRIGPTATVTGIVYAEKEVCQEGVVTGVIKARKLVDCAGIAPANTAPNFMSGTVEPIEDITPYRLPSYVGRLTVLEWYEH
ncbi:MAG: hypothetical protein GF331_19410 [Chitinivibrionales bacterium]|nr:hypothetical protein [Chitinivibrionales bacterium]